MTLRFITTRSDFYWSLLHRILLTPFGAITSLAIWLWAVWGAGQSILKLDASRAVKVIAIMITGGCWFFFLLALTLIVTAASIFFIKKEGLLCTHTLRLTDEGLEEETTVNRSLHRYPGIKGMRRKWGFWVVLMPNGIGFIFRPARVLEGDPEAFARGLAEKLSSAGALTTPVPPRLG